MIVERGHQARHHHAAHRSSAPGLQILSKDEGGWHTPFFNNYRPQFYFRTNRRDRCGDIAAGGHRW